MECYSLKTVLKKATHQTAHRVVGLWQWLCQDAYTQDALLQKIQHQFAPDITSHSLKVYLSTLRQFGCELTKGKNKLGQTTYHIAQHHYMQPLLDKLQPIQLDQLAEDGGIAHSFIEQHQWLDWLNQLANWGGLPWQAEVIDPRWLDMLEHAIATQTLLHITYKTLIDGASRHLHCLPLGGYISRHRHYLRVLIPGKESPLLLRVNRITQLLPDDQSLIKLQQLRALSRYQPLVEVRFPSSNRDQLPLLPDVRAVETDEQGISFFLETRDTFLLLQQLLSCGQPFSVIQPDSLKLQLNSLITVLKSHHQRPLIHHG